MAVYEDVCEGCYELLGERTDVIRFVDPADHTLIRLDLNEGGCTEESYVFWKQVGTSLPEPDPESTFEKTTADGGRLVVSRMPNREITLVLLLTADTIQDLDEGIRALLREVNREENCLEYKEVNASKPLYFKTYRYKTLDHPQYFETNARNVFAASITIVLPCWPWAEGEDETIEVLKNLLVDGSFEEWEDEYTPSHWTLTLTGTHTPASPKVFRTATKYQGTYAAQTIQTYPDDVVKLTSEMMVVDETLHYACRGRTRNNVPEGTMSVEVLCYDADDVYLDSVVLLTDQHINSTEWLDYVMSDGEPIIHPSDQTGEAAYWPEGTTQAMLEITAKRYADPASLYFDLWWFGCAEYNPSAEIQGIVNLNFAEGAVKGDTAAPVDIYIDKVYGDISNIIVGQKKEYAAGFEPTREPTDGTEEVAEYRYHGDYREYDAEIELCVNRDLELCTPDPPASAAVVNWDNWTETRSGNEGVYLSLEQAWVKSGSKSAVCYVDAGNKVTNGSFETALGAEWALTADGGTIARTGTYHVHGSYSLMLTPPAGAGGFDQYATSDYIAIDPTVTYRAFAYVARVTSAVSPSYASVQVLCYSAASALLGTFTIFSGTGGAVGAWTSSGWDLTPAMFAALGAVTKVKIRCRNAGTVTGPPAQTYCFDHVCIYQRTFTLAEGMTTDAMAVADLTIDYYASFWATRNYIGWTAVVNTKFEAIFCDAGHAELGRKTLYDGNLGVEQVWAQYGEYIYADDFPAGTAEVQLSLSRTGSITLGTGGHDTSVGNWLPYHYWDFVSFSAATPMGDVKYDLENHEGRYLVDLGINASQPIDTHDTVTLQGRLMAGDPTPVPITDYKTEDATEVGADLTTGWRDIIFRDEGFDILTIPTHRVHDYADKSSIYQSIRFALDPDWFPIALPGVDNVTLIPIDGAVCILNNVPEHLILDGRSAFPCPLKSIDGTVDMAEVIDTQYWENTPNFTVDPLGTNIVILMNEEVEGDSMLTPIVDVTIRYRPLYFLVNTDDS